MLSCQSKESRTPAQVESELDMAESQKEAISSEAAILEGTDKLRD